MGCKGSRVQISALRPFRYTRTLIRIACVRALTVPFEQSADTAFRAWRLWPPECVYLRQEGPMRIVLLLLTIVAACFGVLMAVMALLAWLVDSWLIAAGLYGVATLTVAYFASRRSDASKQIVLPRPHRSDEQFRKT